MNLSKLLEADPVDSHKKQALQLQQLLLDDWESVKLSYKKIGPSTTDWALTCVDGDSQFFVKALALDDSQLEWNCFKGKTNRLSYALYNEPDPNEVVKGMRLVKIVDAVEKKIEDVSEVVSYDGDSVVSSSVMMHITILGLKKYQAKEAPHVFVLTTSHDDHPKLVRCVISNESEYGKAIRPNSIYTDTVTVRDLSKLADQLEDWYATNADLGDQDDF